MPPHMPVQFLRKLSNGVLQLCGNRVQLEDANGNQIGIGNASAPTVYNLTLTNANTEYSQALPTNCHGFEFQCRTETEIRFAFVTGKVAAPTAPWFTLKAGDYYFSPPINQANTPSTLYFASATAGAICEILAWT